MTQSLWTGCYGLSENLAGLLNQVRAFIRLYVVLGDREAVAVTLWVAQRQAEQADAREDTNA
jgi:hypothetical protein